MKMHQALAITLNLYRVWIALGHLAIVFSIVTTMVWIVYNLVGPGTSTDIEEIITVGANESTAAAKRAYLDVKFSN